VTRGAVAVARGTFKSYATPLAIWGTVVLGLMMVTTTNGYPPFTAATWARADSGHYMTIASGGYDLLPCPPVLHGQTYAEGTWCGNSGWFPGYPWIVGALHRAGLPLVAMGVAVSWAFALGTLLLLWGTFLRATPPLAAVGALLFAAYSPGLIYQYAVFPLSMLAFFTVLHLWFLHRRRWVLAGVAGAAAATAYPIGVMLVPVSAGWILFVARDAPLRERVRRAATASGLSTVGFVLVLAYMRVETGAWDAYFKTQAKYGHGFHNPFATFREQVEPVFHGSLLGTGKAPAVQTLIVGGVLFCVAVHAALHWRRLSALQGLLLVWAALFFLFPLTQANVGLHRSQAALVPAALLVRDLPQPLVAVLVGAVVWISVPIAELFLSGGIT
jgi:hypothetical protein